MFSFSRNSFVRAIFKKLFNKEQLQFNIHFIHFQNVLKKVIVTRTDKMDSKLAQHVSSSWRVDTSAGHNQHPGW